MPESKQLPYSDSYSIQINSVSVPTAVFDKLREMLLETPQWARQILIVGLHLPSLSGLLVRMIENNTT